MTTIGVVKCLNVIKHGRADSLSGGAFIAMEPFNLERMDKRFGRCVVITAACSSHALNDFMIDTKRFEQLAVVFPTVISVTDNSLRKGVDSRRPFLTSITQLAPS